MCVLGLKSDAGRCVVMDVVCDGQVVEKLNLLESSNGTVLHSEIVGAVKMKVRNAFNLFFVFLFQTALL